MHPISIKLRSSVEPIKFPVSPAFVHNYKTKKGIKMENMVDFCAKQNIPFSLEEQNFYKVKRNKEQFRQFKNTINDLYETGRPDEYSVGMAHLDDFILPTTP